MWSKIKTKLLFSAIFLAVFFFFNKSFAATEFVSSVMQSGGDYSTLSSWEAAINTDLTTSTTKVFSGSVTGAIADGATTTLWRSSTSTGITGVSKHDTATQILIDTISSSTYSFQVNDQWRVTASTTNYFQISDTGDSAIATAKIDGAWTNPDTTSVTIDGWTTTSANYISVYTTSTARHNGKWDTNKYRLVATPSNYAAIYIYEDFVRIDGLQVQPTGSGASTHGITVESNTAGAESQISNNIVYGSSTAAGKTEFFGIQMFNGAANTMKVWNNIIYDFTGAFASEAAIMQGGTAGTLYAYNNTIHNSYLGLYRLGGTLTAVNNIIKGSATDGAYVGIFTSSNYNATDVADTGDGGAQSKQSVIFTFADETNDDFHLAQTDTAAKDSATSSVSVIGFTDDIDGETRSGTWDIGADEFVNTAPNASSSLGPANKINGSWSTSTQPLLSFTQSDPNASDTVQFRIQISTSSSFASQTVDYTSALLSQGSTSFTVGQASSSGTYTVGTSSQTLSDSQYYWRVMSTDNSGATSSYTTANSGAVAFGIDTISPTGTIASSTYGTITSSSIIINRPSTSTITESGSGLYQWQVRRNSTTTLSAVSTSTTTTSDTSLTSNTQYVYDVRFIDVAGNTSSYGATSSKYTLTPSPTNLSITPSQTSNALLVDSFNNASSSSSGYYFSNTTNSNNSGWITTNSWTDTGLTCNTSYAYTIKYRNGDAVESATSSVSQTTSACTVSAAVASAGLPISILAGSSAKPILRQAQDKQPVQPNNYATTQPSNYETINTFTKYLYPGLSSSEVRNLQTLLSQYSDIYPEKLITGYFGPLTKQAVQRFQIKYGIANESDNAFGLVGPKTRKILNLLLQINNLQNQLNQILAQLKRS